MHLAALVVVPGFLVLGWWQVTRALGGNALSWVYSVEWPFFAGYAVYMWWKLSHEEPGTRSWGRRAARSGPEMVAAGDAASPPPPPRGEGPAAPGDPGAEDDDLDGYNRYLEALNASGRRKRW